MERKSSMTPNVSVQSPFKTYSVAFKIKDELSFYGIPLSHPVCSLVMIYYQTLSSYINYAEFCGDSVKIQ